MPTIIRRTILNIQTTHEEGGKLVDVPTKLVTALTIIKKPWYGRDFVADLSPEVKYVGPDYDSFNG